ncbi:MAG TPA: squalene/phytoene synthase family protein, partial [Burkholderiaceae bacterium]|nr:squalene/phytoene synthase family protein [Burkholderiaceae bacterium]
KDYRNLDRVYIPLDALKVSGASVEELNGKQASPALIVCLRGLTARTAALLQHSQGFAASINDTRLALEVSVIQALANRLLTILAVRDPLSQIVHLSKTQALAMAASSSTRALLRRLLRTRAPAHGYQTP